MKSGGKYLGNWSRDTMHGYGVMSYANDEQYYGNFEENKKCGYGV